MQPGSFYSRHVASGLYLLQRRQRTADRDARAAQAALHEMGRSHDLVARYGGEEFVCLLPDSDLAGARGKAEALRLAIEVLGIPHETSPTADVVTISIGVAAWIPDGATSHNHLLAAADAALYAAKKGGRNRTCAATVAPSCP